MSSVNGNLPFGQQAEGHVIHNKKTTKRNKPE